MGTRYWVVSKNSCFVKFHYDFAPPPENGPCSIQNAIMHMIFSSILKYCVCSISQDGSINCGVENCITPRCRNPLTESGQCCPTCPDAACYSDGQEYEEGEIWDSPSNPCMVCTCNVSIELPVYFSEWLYVKRSCRCIGIFSWNPLKLNFRFSEI